MKSLAGSCLLATWFGLGLLCPRPLWAMPAHLSPLVPLESARMRDLGPVLRAHDMALIESDAHGMMKQITAMTLCAAPPALVRDVVSHPERNREFVRNITRSEVKRLPDGSLDYAYELSYGLLSIDGHLRYLFQQQEPPSTDREARSAAVIDREARSAAVIDREARSAAVIDREARSAAAIEMYDDDPGGMSHYRWEFLPVGGGTLLVLYGYTDVNHSGGVIQKLISSVPQLEHGLALTSQMSLVLAIKARAEQMVPAPVPLPAPGGASYDFLLARGLLVLMHTEQGRLSTLSMIDRSAASADRLLEVAAEPSGWSGFIPSIKSSAALAPVDGMPAVELEQAVPLISWRTTFGLRKSGAGVDMVGLSGDLRGARLRWDVRQGRTGSGQNQVVLRTSQAFDQSSFLVRQIYKREPLFEYGVNVGLGLVILRGVAARAERLSSAQGPKGATAVPTATAQVRNEAPGPFAP